MLKNSVEYKRFVWELRNVITINKGNKNIVFLCIGSNRIIGDAFGPVVGSILKKQFKNTDEIEIIGNLDDVVTYNNIAERINENNKDNKLIIVVDSALSHKANIGKVFIQNRGLKYAESLKKKNKTIGDISIKAVVGENENNSLKNFYNLQKVSIERIYGMCNIVSNGILDVMNKN
jgi:putative sporulation protein YyaC